MTGRSAGVLYGVGLGPGDPELMTFKAARVVRSAAAVAYFAKRGRMGHARRIASAHIGETAEELRLEYPYTTEIAVDDTRYTGAMSAFYDDSARAVAERLDAGKDVAVLCEGDPFLYGSFMYVFDRLGARYRSEVVPGVPGMSGCWSRALAPMTHGDDVLTVMPGTLGEERLAARIAGTDAAAILKVGRNLPAIRSALERAGRAGDAIYVERGTMDGERVMKLSEMSERPAPYFSMVLVPGRKGRR